MSSGVAVGKMADHPGIQTSVLSTVVLFSVMMAVVPIGTYFGTLKYFWDGSSMYAAISAVFAANAVFVGYLVVAFREESRMRKSTRGGNGVLPSKKFL